MSGASYRWLVPLLCVGACQSVEPAAIEGTVVDEESGRGIEGANVVRRDVESAQHVVARTREGGRYRIEGPAGRTELTAEAGGYCLSRRAPMVPVENFSLSKLRSSIVGVGATLENDLVFHSIVPNGPAARSGLLVGDRLVSIDGRSRDGVEDATVPRKLLRAGPPGSRVELSVMRGGEAHIISIVREALTLSPCEPLRTAAAVPDPVSP